MCYTPNWGASTWCEEDESHKHAYSSLIVRFLMRWWSWWHNRLVKLNRNDNKNNILYHALVPKELYIYVEHNRRHYYYYCHMLMTNSRVIINSNQSPVSRRGKRLSAPLSPPGATSPLSSSSRLWRSVVNHLHVYNRYRSVLRVSLVLAVPACWSRASITMASPASTSSTAGKRAPDVQPGSVASAIRFCMYRVWCCEPGRNAVGPLSSVRSTVGMKTTRQCGGINVLLMSRVRCRSHSARGTNGVSGW